MTTQLAICQMALAECGARSTITALNDGSPEAGYCSLYYGPVRDQALRAARWNCAGRVDLLDLWKALPGTPENPTATTSTWTPAYPPPPWLYAYTLDDAGSYIFARSVRAQYNVTSMPVPIFPIAGGLSYAASGAPRVPFAISSDPWDTDGTTPLVTPKRTILTNAQTPIFEWTYQVPEDVWDDSLVMVMVLGLAARLAIALTSDKQLAQLKAQTANDIILSARAADGNEGITILDNIPDWLTIRGAGSNKQFEFWFPYGPLFAVLP